MHNALKSGVAVLVVVIVGLTGFRVSRVIAAGNTDIAHVSARQILNESAEMNQLKAKLEKIRQDTAKEVTTKEKALQETHLQLLQLGGVFSTSKRARVQAQEERQRAELKLFREQFQAEIAALERQAQVNFNTHLAAVLSEIARVNRLRLVLNADTAVVWAAPGMDITTQVLAKLNAPPEKPASQTSSAAAFRE